jgi:hypothetical protein
MIFEEVEGEQHTFGVFGGGEVAVTAADDDVVKVGNSGCFERFLEFRGLGGVDRMIAVAVDDEGGWNAGGDIGRGGHLAGASEDCGRGLGPARGLATRSLDGSGVVVAGLG